MKVSSFVKKRKQKINYTASLDDIYSLVRNDFVYNTTRLYLGAVYPIHGQMRNYWINAYWVFGPPVCNECYYPEGTTDYVAQWFEPFDNYYVSIAYKTATGEFYKNLPGINPDAEHFNQDKLKNCADNAEGCGGGDNLPPSAPTGLQIISN